MSASLPQRRDASAIALLMRTRDAQRWQAPQ